MRKNKRKGCPAVVQVFRKIAQSLLQSTKISFGAFGRRLRGRKGPQIAIKAIARKLAIQYWRLMVKGGNFEQGVKQYDALVLRQKEKYLRKLALELKIDLA